MGLGKTKIIGLQIIILMVFTVKDLLYIWLHTSQTPALKLQHIINFIT